MKWPLCLVLCLFCFANVSQAQVGRPDTLIYRYPETLITATRLSLPLQRIPFAANVVGRDAVEDSPRGVAIDELLKLTPGVKVDNQANGDRIHLSMRGQGILTERGIRGIKILLDEIPVNDPTGFAPDLFELDPNSVDRMEILRGPAASLHGGSASGGIINILTDSAPNRAVYATNTSVAGSNNFWKSYTEIGGRSNPIDYRLSYSRAMGDGYRDHTQFWGNNLYGKASYTPTSQMRLTGIVSQIHFFHQNPEGINLDQYRENPLQANPDAIPYNEYLETDRTSGGLTGAWKNGPHEIHFAGFTKRTLFTEVNNHTFTHRTIATPGVSALYGFTARDVERKLTNRVTVGTDLEWQKIGEHRTANHHALEGDTLLSKEEIRQRGLGFYAIDQVDYHDKWTFLASGRYDEIHNELEDQMPTPHDLSGNADFSKVTGRVGLTRQIRPDLSAYVNWGYSFLPPATEELAQNPDHFGGFNTHLVPATSSGFDVGSRGTFGKRLYCDADIFYLDTKNDFDRYRITDSLRNQETFYRNAGSSHRVGLELLARFTPVEKLHLQGAYTFSHFKYANTEPVVIMMDDPSIHKSIADGNWLPNSPQHQLTLDAEMEVLPRLSLGVTTETLSKTYIDGANIEAEAASGYTLIHARAAYVFRFGDHSLELNMSARNIGDTKYVAFTEPDPGGNSYQPGAGREFFGGLRILF